MEARVERRPKVFIGSSVPGLDIAEALQFLLEHSANCQIWSQGVMELSTSTLDNLLGALPRFEFAIFVLTGDDKTQQRDASGMTPRDNVILELGLFLGYLGPRKTFMVRPRGLDLLLPTDLFGIEAADYDPTDDDPVSALGTAATRIKRAISKARTSPATRSGA
jgi:predicted nucleotide-binding protein